MVEEFAAADRDESETAPSAHTPGRSISLSREQLEALSRVLGDVVGSEQAGEILFRVGRDWGRTEGRRHGRGADDERGLRSALSRVQHLGLGTVWVDAFEMSSDKVDCRIAGRVVDSIEGSLHGGQATSSGTACGLTVGFLTGYVSELVGVDVVCSPFRCEHVCESGGCRFEIRPAHDSKNAESGTPAPSGSARFFLGSVGSSMGDGNLSLGDLIENTSDAVVLIDSDDVVRFWSRGAEEMFQFPREEVVGQPVGFIVPTDLQESDELGKIKALLEGQQAVVNFITRRVRKDGRELTVSLTRTVLHDDRGRTMGSTAIMRDITEQRRNEEELYHTRSLALIGQLSSKIAHEIKNPLAGIYAAVQLIGRDFPLDDPKREIFEEVGHEIRRLDETVKELLNFARPIPPKPATVELRTLVADIVGSLCMNPVVERHEITIDIEEGLFCSLDTRLMKQVFTNLVLNGAQAMEDPGSIRISASREADRVQVEVLDSGPGIPKDVRAQVFEPFFTTKSRGTGLGLSVARKNVEAHRGTIEILDGARCGTLVRLTLPLVDHVPGT